MEKSFTIPTTDDYLIHGIQNSVASTRVLVLVHGLTGYQYEQHYMRAISFFNKAGFDVVRFDFYSSLPQGRKLIDSSIPLQTKDLNVVVAHFAEVYENVFVAGHSLAGPVILAADQSRISRIVLWDPTSGMKSVDDLAQKGCHYDERIDAYVMDSLGRDILLGQAMVDSWIKAFDVAHYVSLATKPLKVIFAGEENKHEAWIPQLASLEVDNEYVTVVGATHGFVEAGTLEHVYAETLSWIEAD